MIIKKCKFKSCNNNFKGCGQKYFCSKKCQRKDYYFRNKKKFIKNAKIWQKNNPEKVKKIYNTSGKIWRRKNKDRINELMIKGYYNNKNKWYSRNKTYFVVMNNRVNLNKKCKICLSNKNLEIHHEIYPLTIHEIIKAINNQKIYFLCYKHHKLKHKK